MLMLKERLAAIVEFVPSGSVVIDVGTDHAYLPVYLVQSGKCPRSVGVDIHQGPYLSALEQVKFQGLEHKISVYLGDGLKLLPPGAGDVVVAAGMGGTTIINILDNSPKVLQSVKRLILQPMVAGAALRLWLLTNGWAIVDEQLVEEEKRIYEIIVAEPGSQEIPPETKLELGPCIIAKNDPLLGKYVNSKIQALQGVLRQMEKAQSHEVLAKRKEIAARIAEIQGVLK